MKTEAARAAAQIRKELKAAGIKARVTSKSYSMGSSVNVNLADELPATAAAVRAALCKYEYGHFDGMTDIYEISNRNDDLPQVKFVFVNNNFSDEIKQAAWDFAKGHWGDMEAAPASFQDAWQFNCRNGGGAEIMNRELSNDRGGFWTARKPRVAA